MKLNRGLGGWLGIIPFVSLAVTGIVARQMGGGREVTGYACMVSSILSGLFALALDLHTRLQRPSKVVETRTGREFHVRPVHSLIGIPALLWVAPHAALAVWFVSLANA